MFTGLIEEVGTIDAMEAMEGGRQMQIQASFADNLRVDQSISVNGVCLTVTTRGSGVFTVQSVEETLRKTTLGLLQEGDPVNLERSLKLDDGIEGHLVQGHVDGVGKISTISEEGADRLFEIEYPAESRDLVVSRGSIAVDGISLTVARIERDHHFTVAIIPYTIEHTNLSSKREGDPVNLEFDMFGKYVVNYLESRNRSSDADSADTADDITASWLKERGY